MPPRSLQETPRSLQEAPQKPLSGLPVAPKRLPRPPREASRSFHLKTSQYLPQTLPELSSHRCSTSSKNSGGGGCQPARAMRSAAPGVFTPGCRACETPPCSVTARRAPLTGRRHSADPPPVLCQTLFFRSSFSTSFSDLCFCPPGPRKRLRNLPPRGLQKGPFVHAFSSCPKLTRNRFSSAFFYMMLCMPKATKHCK